MNSNKGRNIVIGTLLAAVAIMAVGYAALAQTLTINGTATIDSTWNVKITKAEIVSASTTAPTTSATPSVGSGGTTASFKVNFTKPGQKITYKITVTNSGSLNAILRSWTLSPQNSGSTQVTDGIYYNVTGVTPNKTRCNSGGGTNEVLLEIGWKQTGTEMPAQLSKEITITLNYEQVS